MNTIDLTGRCAIITGGAQGIGLAIANRLLTSGHLFEQMSQEHID